MGDVVILDLALCRSPGTGRCLMHDIDHGAEAAIVAHQLLRQRDEMHGEIAQRAEPRLASRVSRHDQGSSGSAI